MLTIVVEEVTECLTQVAIEDWPSSMEEVNAWMLFKKLFISEYFRSRSVCILTDDEDHSICRDFLPNERVKCLVPRPTGRRGPFKVKFLICRIKEVTINISSEIVECIDFSIGLLWMSSSDVHKHVCELANHQTSIARQLDYLKGGTFPHDLLIPQDDANCLFLYRPLERIYDLAIRVAAYSTDSFDLIEITDLGQAKR